MAPTTSLTSHVVFARTQQASATRTRRAASCLQPLSAPSPAHLRRPVATRSARSGLVVCAGHHHAQVLSNAAAPPDWQVLARAEIPSHIPRVDFLKQIYTWAVQHVASDGMKVYGSPMKVETIDKKGEDGELETVAFSISILKYLDDKNTQKVITLECGFDDEVVPVYDMVSQDDNTGFPIMTTRDGKEKFTKGKYLVIRRIRASAPKEYVPVVKKLLETTMEAVNKYYAFGSTFSEDF